MLKWIIAAIALLLFLARKGSSVISGTSFLSATPSGSPVVGGSLGGSYATIGNVASPSAPVPQSQMAVRQMPIQLTPPPAFKPTLGVNQITATTTPTPAPKVAPKYVAPWNNPLNVSRVSNGRGGYWTA